MGRTGRAAFSLAAILLQAAAAWSLSVSDGRLRLILHEGIGRFSLYVQAAPGEKAIPLMADKDPRTSFVNLAVDNRVYRLGDSTEFKESVERTPRGARFLWESSKVWAAMEFTPLSSVPAGANDGVEIRLKVRNLTESALPIGARVLLDTWLGEGKTAHFTTSRGQEISRETSLATSEDLRFWASLPAGLPGGPGLQSLIAGGAVTRPDRIVFGNWARLSESSWLYEPAGSRHFSYPPYSINDSAVAQYYDPQPVKSGAEREIVLILGRYNPSGYIAQAGEAAQDLDALPKETTSAASKPSSEAPRTAGPELRRSIQAAAERLNDLIREIDLKLSSGREIPPEEIRQIEETLKELNDQVNDLQLPPDG
jgi:hypothetical protein